MESQQKTSRVERATPEQLQHFVNFCREHPAIQAGKNNPTAPNAVKNLWEQLASELNAMRGPTRTWAKWKDNLSVWKCQLRSRARKLKMDQRLTGGGPCKKSLSDFEEQALSTFGAAAVDGLDDVQSHGLSAQSASCTVAEVTDQHMADMLEDFSEGAAAPSSIVSNGAPGPSAEPSSAQFIYTPSSSPMPSPLSLGSRSPSIPPGLSRQSSHASRQAMYQSLMESMERRDRREEIMVSALTSLTSVLAELVNKFDKQN